MAQSADKGVCDFCKRLAAQSDVELKNKDYKMESFKYLFAKKNGRTLCLKYNDKWELKQFEYLNDKEYVLTPASESHWNRQIDEVGKPVECYILDNELQEFDVGSF